MTAFVGKERDDRRRGARDVADAADDVGYVARRGRDELALVEPPARVVERGFRLFDLVAGGEDLLVARRKPGDREIGREFAHARRRDVVSGLRRIEIGLRGEAAAVEVLAAVQRALRVVLLHLRRLEARVDGRDLLRPAAVENVGEFGLRLAERRLGVVDGDFGVGRLQRRDPVARLELVAAANVFGRHARDLDRRDVDVFAFDIADGGVGRGRAGGQDPGDQRERADRFENHGAFFPREVEDGVEIADDETLDGFSLGGSDVAPVHAAQHGRSGEAEIDELADEREHRKPRRLAFGRRAGRARPHRAGARMHRPDRAIEALERG